MDRSVSYLSIESFFSLVSLEHYAASSDIYLKTSISFSISSAMKANTSVNYSVKISIGKQLISFASVMCEFWEMWCPDFFFAVDGNSCGLGGGGLVFVLFRGGAVEWRSFLRVREQKV